MSVLIHGAVADPAVAKQIVLDGNPAPPDAVERIGSAVARLLDFGATPIAFFDGAGRPLKQREADHRRSQREAAVLEARQLHAASGPGQQTDSKLKKVLRAAAGRTPELQAAVVDAMRELRVPVVGAYHEADGQLALAFRRKEIDLVMTKDGDLLALGVPVLRLGQATFEWMSTKTLQLYDLGAQAAAGPQVAPVPDKPDLAWAARAYGSRGASHVDVTGPRRPGGWRRAREVHVLCTAPCAPSACGAVHSKVDRSRGLPHTAWSPTGRRGQLHVWPCRPAAPAHGQATPATAAQRMQTVGQPSGVGTGCPTL